MIVLNFFSVPDIFWGFFARKKTGMLGSLYKHAFIAFSF